MKSDFSAPASDECFYFAFWKLRELVQERFHFGARVLVARFGGGINAGREHAAGFVCARFADQKLAIHLISGNVVSLVLEESTKVLVCGSRIATVHAFQRQAVARERVVGLFGDKLFEHLAAGFVMSGGLFSHLWLMGTSRIIRGRGKAAKRGERRGFA